MLLTVCFSPSEHECVRARKKAAQVTGRTFETIVETVQLTAINNRNVVQNIGNVGQAPSTSSHFLPAFNSLARNGVRLRPRWLERSINLAQMKQNVSVFDALSDSRSDLRS